MPISGSNCRFFEVISLFHCYQTLSWTRSGSSMLVSSMILKTLNGSFERSNLFFEGVFDKEKLRGKNQVRVLKNFYCLFMLI